jgi:pyrroloquinoline quinone biosynthesis protein D
VNDNAALRRHGPDVVAQRAAGRHVLLNVRSGQYYAVDEVAARIWELCDGTRTLQDIAAVLVEEYDAAPADIAADVERFVSELVSESLLV